MVQKKYKGYSIGKFKCIFCDKIEQLDVYLSNFKRADGREYGSNDSFSIGKLTAEFKYLQTGNGNPFDIKIHITDLFVNQENDKRFGFGTLLWFVLVDDCIDWYLKYKGVEKKINVQVSGWLSKTDFNNGNWNASFPFFITIANNILSKIEKYSFARTIFKYEKSMNAKDDVFCYDSDCVGNVDELERLGKAGFCEKLISFLGSIQYKSYIVIQLFS